MTIVLCSGSSSNVRETRPRTMRPHRRTSTSFDCPSPMIDQSLHWKGNLNCGNFPAFIWTGHRSDERVKLLIRSNQFEYAIVFVGNRSLIEELQTNLIRLRIVVTIIHSLRRPSTKMHLLLYYNLKFIQAKWCFGRYEQQWNFYTLKRALSYNLARQTLKSPGCISKIN